MKKGGSEDKVLTIDEQIQLQHTAVLINSSLFKLQVEELLHEVDNSKYYTNTAIANWLEEFTQTLKDASSTAIADGLLPRKLNSRWVSSISDKFNVTEGEVGFKPIVETEIVGSFVARTVTHPITNIDVTFTIPDSFLPQSEFAYQSYQDIRNLYVAAMSALIRQSPSLLKLIKNEIEFANFKCDPNKPILALIANLNRRNPVAIRLIPVISLQSIPIHKLNRQLPRAGVSTSIDFEDKHYKIMSLLEDGAIVPQNRLIGKLLQTFPNARGAILLMKTWLSQRGLRFGADILDGHHCAMLLGFMVFARIGSVGSIASKAGGDDISASILLFQAALQHLASLAGAQKQLVVNFNNPTGDSISGYTACGEMHVPELCHDVQESFMRIAMLHPLVGKAKSDVIDYNSSWRVSASGLQQLVLEAKHALRIMQSDDETSFHQIFMDKSSFFHRSDLYFACPLAESTEPAGIVSNFIFTLCNTSLGSGHGSLDRVSHIAVSVCPDVPNSSAIDSMVCSSHRFGGRQLLHIGLVLNPANANRRVDRGPSAAVSIPDTGSNEESGPAASLFQRFWGEKCQLRRFQDGSIVEAVVWDSAAAVSSNVSSDAKKRKRGGSILAQSTPQQTVVDSITEQIVKYVLSTHARVLVGEDAVGLLSSAGSKLEKHLPAPRLLEDMTSYDPRISVDADTMVRKSIEAVDQLRDILASRLTDLPLTILSVMACCPELRYTAVYPAVPHPYLDSEDIHNAIRAMSGHSVSLVVQPLTIIGTLESSGKWPSDPDAKRKSLIAFLFRISELLLQQFKIRSTPQSHYLDITFKGFVFRLALRIDSPTNSASAIDHEDASRRNLCLPIEDDEFVIMHHQAVRSLCSQYPSYAAAVRLTRAWVDSVMLSGHVTIPMIEVLVASVFVNAPSDHVPTTPSAAFAQALYRLCSWDWNDDPLCVDLSPKVDTLLLRSTSHINALKSSFIARFRAIKKEVLSSGAKHILPPICIAAMYNDDSSSSNVKSRLADFFVDPQSLFCIENATVSILIAAAKETSSRLLSSLVCGDVATHDLWVGLDKTILQSCNLVLKFRRAVCCQDDSEASHLVSLSGAAAGPAAARIKIFTNMASNQHASASSLIIRDGSTVTSTQAAIVKDLRERLRDVALVFWNASRGDLVGIVWKPKAVLGTSFSVLDSRNQMLVASLNSHNAGEGDLPVFNVAKIVSEIVEIGNGLLGDIRIC